MTPGELANNLARGSTPEQLLASQEGMDARRLIESGRRTEDTEAVQIGQRRMRIALGKPNPDDLDK